MKRSPVLVVIAMLDKQDPFSHSFVDGMLVKVVGRSHLISIQLLVSSSVRGSAKPRRLSRSLYWPALFSRRGFGRFGNLLRAITAARVLIARAKKKNRTVVLFVRNDPILLFSGALLRAMADRLVFQSSFPHEESARYSLKGIGALILYRLSRRRVDAITAVSPLGLDRLRKHFPATSCAEYIPLLADLAADGESPRRKRRIPDADIRFIYAGSHLAERQLELVLSSIVDAFTERLTARFIFVGGTSPEITRMLEVPGVLELQSSGRIEFLKKVPRAKISSLLCESDVGLSLIPPLPHYREASPTKLTEYLAAGLAVIATYGIPMQERFVLESGAGILVPWNRGEIAKAFRGICADPVLLAVMQARAGGYSKEHLQYSAYFPNFCRLIGDESIASA